MSPQRKAPRTPDPAEQLRGAVQGLLGSLMRYQRQAALAEGLTFSQFFTLRRIQRAGTIPATKWAHEAGITPSSLSSVVDGLVEAGFVRRARGTQDRRVVQVSLTPKGTRRMEKLETEQRVLWNEMTRGIGASELLGAADLLRRLVLSPSLVEARTTPRRRKSRGAA